MGFRFHPASLPSSVLCETATLVGASPGEVAQAAHAEDGSGRTALVWLISQRLGGISALEEALVKLGHMPA